MTQSRSVLMSEPTPASSVLLGIFTNDEPGMRHRGTGEANVYVRGVIGGVFASSDQSRGTVRAQVPGLSSRHVPLCSTGRSARRPYLREPSGLSALRAWLPETFAPGSQRGVGRSLGYTAATHTAGGAPALAVRCLSSDGRVEATTTTPAALGVRTDCSRAVAVANSWHAAHGRPRHLALRRCQRQIAANAFRPAASVSSAGDS
jgi:hypothetical protein